MRKNYQPLMELENADGLHICKLNIDNIFDIQSFAKDCDYILYLNMLDFKSKLINNSKYNF